MIRLRQCAEFVCACVVCVCILLAGNELVRSASAAGEGEAIGEAKTLPRQVRFSGALADAAGAPLTGAQGVTYSLYAEQTGGAPLWLETQNVTADDQGRYSVLLGSMREDGLPQDVFTTNEARWLGVQVNQPGAVEQPRVLLVSVPYALKAADAETLGGKPVTAFLLAPSANGDQIRDSNGAEAAAMNDGLPTASVAVANRLVKYTDGAGAMDSSSVTDDGTIVGIGSPSTGAKLHVAGSVPGTATSDLFSLSTTDGVLRSEVTARGLQFWRFNNGVSNVGQMAFATPGGSPGIVMWTGPTFDQNRFDIVNYGSQFSLGFSADAGGTGQVLNLKPGGNVGIGTAAPTAKLEVSGGDVKVSGGGKFVGDGSLLTNLPGGGVGGTGTINSIPKFTAATTLGNARITDDATDIVLGDGTLGNFRILGNALSPNIVGGYSTNSVTAGAVGATISGGGSSSNGTNNRVTDNYGTVGGGTNNQAGDADGIANNKWATVSGGITNTASGDRSTVGGGSTNTASGGNSTVGGGTTNLASGASAATVGGGSTNTASGETSTVGGGTTNTASGSASIVGGGSSNTASGSNTTVGGGVLNQATVQYGTVAGGNFNTVTFGGYGTVGGGQSNIAYGGYATVPGGLSNYAQGTFSFAAGRRAQALHDGAFVWGDGTNADFASTGANQFLIRAGGGVGIGKNNPTYALDVLGQINASGGLCMAGDCKANWAAVGGGGGVTSVAAGTGLSASPSPIIATGTLSIDTAVVPRLGVQNNFTDAQFATAAAGFGALNGTFTAAGGAGVFGLGGGVTGTNYGGYFQSLSTTGIGVFGAGPTGVSGQSASGMGVYGESVGTTGRGIQGYATAGSGEAYGVGGSSNSTSGRGVFGHAIAATGVTFGVYGVSASTSGRGVFGIASASSGLTYGVYGQSDSASGAGNAGVYGVVTSAPTGTNYGVHGKGSGIDGIGVFGESFSTGVYGQASDSGGKGVYGRNTATTSGPGAGVYGQSDYTFGKGVIGRNTATSGSAVGVYGQSDSPDGIGVWAAGDAYVDGDLHVVGAKNFKIDHPLDPANKYLRHASIESSDVMNLYNGNAVVDEQGEAWVELPDWFETLNREFRYQLTALGAPGPNLYVAHEIEGNRFQIAGGKPGMKVSWQVTGIRQDPYMKDHPMQVEQEKSGDERGLYQHPELYGQPKEKGIGYAHRPQEQQDSEVSPHRNGEASSQKSEVAQAQK